MKHVRDDYNKMFSSGIIFFNKIYSVKNPFEAVDPLVGRELRFPAGK